LASARLRHTASKWILSSYDTDPIKALFKGFHFKRVEASSGMSTSREDHKNGHKRTLNRELLITNFSAGEATTRRKGSHRQATLDL
jgi:hypothetical protein